MKRIQQYLSLLLLATITSLVSTSCTHNNGDIGDWFGSWRIETISIDGDPDPEYTRPCVIWKFQNAATEILMPDFDNHTTIGPTATGTWHEEDGYLTVDFTYDLGTPPAITHLPARARLKIIRLSGRIIELEYSSADDSRNYIYKLKKWG